MVKIDKCRVGKDNNLLRSCFGMSFAIDYGAVDQQTLKMRLPTSGDGSCHAPLITLKFCPYCGARLTEQKRRKKAKIIPAVPVGGQLPIAFGRRSR